MAATYGATRGRWPAKTPKMHKGVNMYQTILIPLDGSKRAEAILDHVENLGKIHEAKVILLKVEEDILYLDRDEVIDMDKYQEELEKRKKMSGAYLETLQARLRKKDIQAQTRLVYGPVVKAILATADEIGADLIAIASHGVSGSTRASYGSVAAGVLQGADIPILLIRSDNDE